MFSSVKSHRTRKPNRFLPRLEELETRALPSTYVSTNWSGYGVETDFLNPAGHVVNGVSAKWTVPTVTNNNSFGWSSTWVGIDGFSSNTVEQIGTEQDTALTSLYYGMPQYYAWIEMYPAYPVALFTVSPGDSISASVTYTGPANDTTSKSPFFLTITDSTNGHSAQVTQALTSAQRSSAEWIEEAPSSNSGVLPLANFGSVAFSGASASVGSNTGPISAFPNASINMITRFGQLLDTTSNLTTSGDGFTVTTTGSSTSTGGGGHHRHGLPTIIANGQTTILNVPPVPTAAMAPTSATVLSVAHANILATGAVTVAQNPQAVPPRGYLIVAPTSTETTDDTPKKDNQQGDGAMSDRPASSSGASRLVEGVGGTMSRQALDEFFADPTSREQTMVEEEPGLAGSAAPVIDVVTSAELSVLLLGAYLGNPIKAKETEDNTKRKVKWL